ncbi:uncharacterized protein LOC114717649 [Neltuma alba]|uniref:uncharacterized protein LOC114717649 n=1 Tax=Neltuma alba TaxID=207710 RepID=UPI0010A44E9A|nr:uncharacterized protein LOC114717649 [Prosopis alba]
MKKRCLTHVWDEFWRVRELEAEKEGEGVKERQNVGGMAPEEGCVKVNCDGSFKDGIAAIGMICRDCEGNFLWGFGEKVQADGAVIAEILALRKVLILISDMSYDKVVIETDCTEVFWCWSKASADGIDWRGRWEIQEVIEVLKSLRYASVTLISRKSNLTADFIAVSCGRGVSPIGWVNSPSPPLASILADDLFL